MLWRCYLTFLCLSLTICKCGWYQLLHRKAVKTKWVNTPRAQCGVSTEDAESVLVPFATFHLPDSGANTHTLMHTHTPFTSQPPCKYAQCPRLHSCLVYVHFSPSFLFLSFFLFRLTHGTRVCGAYPRPSCDSWKISSLYNMHHLFSLRSFQPLKEK